MNLVLHVTPLLWRNALIINPLHALLKFSNLIRSLQYINAFSTKAFFSPSEYFMTFNGLLFDLNITLNHSVSLVWVFFDLLIVLPFFIHQWYSAFHFCSNLSFNWWSLLCFAFTGFVNTGNFKMLPLFSFELNCATAMYLYNLML